VRFKLPHDPGQWRSVVMYLRFLHSPLPILIVEELNEVFKRVILIVNHIGERSALTIVKKLFLGNGDGRHSWFPGYLDSIRAEPNVAAATYAPTNIVGPEARNTSPRNTLPRFSVDDRIVR
jgi:hypothetical protein